jgi:metal-responsive CopG/Arc/MetJ family transcriptional regulator
VKRTQLYLDDDLWNALHVRARQSRTTVSELVRQAARERYLGSADARAKAMQAVVGIWEDRKDIVSAEAYVRGLRRGSRLKRLSGA